FVKSNLLAQNPVTHTTKFIVPRQLIDLDKAKNIIVMNFHDLHIDRIEVNRLEGNNESIGTGENGAAADKPYRRLHLLEDYLLAHCLFEALTGCVADSRRKHKGPAPILPHRRINTNFISMNGEVQIGQPIESDQSPQVLIFLNWV